jgi:hypothetical protein
MGFISDNISGTSISAETIYITSVGSGTPQINLGLDSNFQVVTGTTGGGGLQNLSLFSLPAPFLKVSNQDITLETFDLSTVDLINSPIISTNDLSIEQISHGVWVEMLVYRKKRKRKGTNLYKKGFVIPPDWTWDSILGTGVNSLQQELLNLYPTKTIMNRGGETQNVNQSRPNHYKVTGNTQSINLGYYLNGRFTYYNVAYLLSDGSPDYINLPIPVSRNQQYAHGRRFCYHSKLTPTYIKFRYIMFDPDFNGGKGRFVTGPLISTIKITLENFPFVPTTPYCVSPFGCSSTELSATCTTKPGTYNKLKCSIESNVP